MDTEKVRQQVKRIHRSPYNDWGRWYPCQLTLAGGTVADPAYVVLPENAKDCEVLIDILAGKVISAGRVDDVNPSQHRLSYEITKTILNMGECKPDLYMCDLILRDGSVFTYAGSGLLDFPDLPQPYRTDDVVECRETFSQKEADFGILTPIWFVFLFE